MTFSEADLVLTLTPEYCCVHWSWRLDVQIMGLMTLKVLKGAQAQGQLNDEIDEKHLCH
jgi:hypothetical protein